MSSIGSHEVQGRKKFAPAFSLLIAVFDEKESGIGNPVGSLFRDNRAADPGQCHSFAADFS
jgi:hypothetical protein